MASLRKASSYSKRKARPFTRRANTRKKAYIKTVPPLKIVKYNMGNTKAFNKDKFKYILRFVSRERVQIRDNSLEACRLILNKVLDKELPGKYYFVIKVYPHHILRENKTAAGAGADRLSSGMKHSYGINIGRAAIVQPGKELFFIATDSQTSITTARKAMALVKPKLPCKGKIVFEKVEE